MKNILIPTDFSTEALACIPAMCQQSNDAEIRLVFIHLFKCSDSITDLLMLARRNREYEHVSDEFYQECEQIKASCPQVKGIKIDFFYGSTLRMFRNYLEANSIDAALDLGDCSVRPLNKRSVDPSNLIARCGLEAIKVQPAKQKSESRILNPVYEQVLNEAI